MGRHGGTADSEFQRRRCSRKGFSARLGGEGKQPCPEIPAGWALFSQWGEIHP